MKVTQSESGGKLILRLAGELDHHQAGELCRDLIGRLDTLMPRDCVLDLEDVSFMDSAGIAVILKTYKRMRSLGGRMWVENVPSQPMRVLEASGIGRLIEISALL